MEKTSLANQLSEEENVKVAYALNLCAVSISQIIDSNDIFVLKQEREAILNNLNLQNFVKHPALLDVLKRILDTITYLEIQAGDLSFIEKEYQRKLKDAIWTAVPSPGSLFAGGAPVTLAIAVAAQIGTAYMNYRRNKSQYELEKEKSEWELRRHEIEQLEGLRTQLFETAWRLSADYDFDENYRLTQKQLSRYSGALLEPDPLKRYERLDVMSDKFKAFPPFWYYKGNAAMEVFRSERYAAFAAGYKNEALEAYNEFHKRHFEFLREDVIAASCCLEHISLLEPNDESIKKLLSQTMRLAGDNYDVLQQGIFVNLQLKKFDEVIPSLREMVANGYNLGLNGLLLSRIYFNKSSRVEYEKLRAIAGDNNVLPWSDDVGGEIKMLGSAETQLMRERLSKLADEYLAMAKRIMRELNARKTSFDTNKIMYQKFQEVSAAVLKYRVNTEEQKLAESFKSAENKLKQAIADPNEKTLREFYGLSRQVNDAIFETDFSLQISEGAPALIEKMRQVAKA
jgi:hypothetical protein